MASTQYPLQVPDELMAEVESTAKRIHLSKADVMRQSIKLGLPKLREKLSGRDGRITNVDLYRMPCLEKCTRALNGTSWDWTNG